MVLVAAANINAGPVKGILQFIRNIKNENVEFLLFNFWQHNNPVPDPFEAETLKLGIPCKFIRMGRHNYLLMILDTIRAIRENNITIFQTHGFKPAFLGLCAKILCNAKWICFMHGTTAENAKVRMYNLMNNLMQRFADRTVLVTENQRPKIWGGYNKKRVKVLHNAVDINHPVKLSENHVPIRESLSLPLTSKTIVVVGRLSPEKGIDIFLQALSVVAKENPNICGIIVGDGQEKEALTKQAAFLGISDKVRFVGFTNTPGDFMIDSDMIVLPSRSEGIPNVALEAMALGKPVVATAVGGTPEVIEHEKSGLLVPSENPQGMAQAILRVLNNKDLCVSLSQNALAQVREKFSIESRCSKLIEIYSEISG